MNLIPLEDRVVIIQDAAKKETEAGIIIPDTAQEKPSVGTIHSIGPGKADKGSPIGYLLNDEWHESLDNVDVKRDDRIVPLYRMEIKVGDRVIFPRYAGIEVDIDGGPKLIVRVTDLIARV